MESVAREGDEEGALAQDIPELGHRSEGRACDSNVTLKAVAAGRACKPPLRHGRPSWFPKRAVNGADRRLCPLRHRRRRGKSSASPRGTPLLIDYDRLVSIVQLNG